MRPFDGNDYRKRVLSAIDARGGAQTSDAFEQYDLPLDEADRLTDHDVAAQVDAVWAFWQKQRDHPKYRGLVTALLALHGELAPRLRDAAGRRRLAEDARRARADRDAARCLPLDAAIARLVERFGGLPADKLAGLRAVALRAVASAAGLDARTTEERIAAQVQLDVKTPVAPPAPDFRQVRGDLDELGRLLGVDPPVSLYDLLGLPPGAAAEQVAAERSDAAARNRELRPDRRRALVDDLLAAVTTLLVHGDPDAYLDAVADDVRARLRPRVAMVVLVEDGLGPDDLAVLVAEAEAAGLDPARARQVLADLANESGVVVPPDAWPAGRPPAAPRPRATGPAAPRPPARRPPPSGGAWQEPLSRARDALRAGRVVAARRHLDEARQLAGGMLPPLRVLDEEVGEVLREAQRRWAEVAAALADDRPTRAAAGLEQLAATAADLPGPAGESVPDALAAVRARLEQAAARQAAAALLHGAQRELALLEALGVAPDSEALLAEVRELGVAPATEVRAEPAGGGVRVSWAASTSPGPVDYRVLGPDGRVLGTTRGTVLEVAAGLPAYTVVARRAGLTSAPASSAPASSAMAPPPPPVPALTVVAMGTRVRLVFPPPARGRAEVRRLPPGAAVPVPGSVVADPGQLGELVPAMGPGLAVDRRPPAPLVHYVVLVVDGLAVAGASAAWVDQPGAQGLHVRHGHLCWQWPEGGDEAVVCWREDAAPRHARDPEGTSRPVTLEQYEDEGGVQLPAARPLHVAVFAAVRRAGELHPVPGGARLHLPAG